MTYPWGYLQLSDTADADAHPLGCAAVLAVWMLVGWVVAYSLIRWLA